MKTCIIFFLLFLSLTVNASHYTVDPSTSWLEWTATKWRGKHYGKIRLLKGVVKSPKSFKSSKIIVDMNSISVDDLKGEWATKIITHLKADDFFHVSKFPVSTFEVSNSKTISPKKIEITGTLKIKEKSIIKKIILDVEESDQKVIMRGNFSFDRTKFGIKFNSSSFIKNIGDKVIGDKVDLVLNLIILKTK
jgi:polyisoprenoid-binding protein YceI